MEDHNATRQKLDPESPEGKLVMFGYRSGLKKALELVNEQFLLLDKPDVRSQTFEGRHAMGVAATVINEELERSLGKVQHDHLAMTEDRRRGKV